MNRKAAFLLAATILAGGCATNYPVLPPAPVLPAAVAEVDDAEPAPRNMSPSEAIGGSLSYIWSEDETFRIFAPVGSTVPVSLIKGERVLDVTMTDHFGWNNNTVAYGSGRSNVPVVVLTAVPGEAKRTTAIITTSRRMYLLDLIPRNTGHKTVRFHAPQKAQSPAVASSKFQRAYTMQGPFASWRPVRVTDDGKQTFVELSPSVGATGMPTVVGIDADGVERPLNARRVGNHIVADGVYGTVRIRRGSEHVDARRI
jgi:type IV secretion system protein TrbG